MLRTIVESDSAHAPPVWVLGNGSDPIVPKAVATSPELEAVLRAYATFRLDDQLRYVEHILRPANSGAHGKGSWYPGSRLPLRQWRGILHRVWRCALYTLIALHLMLIVTVLVPAANDLGHMWLHIGVLWAALVAAGSKTLAEGFALGREIERYEEYRAVCAELLRRFQLPGTGPDELFQLMVHMERASFEEMRVFLRSNLESTFVL